MPNIRRSICRTLLIFRPLRTIEESFLQVQSQGLGIDAESKAEITKQIRAINYTIGRKEDELSKCMAAEGVDPPPPPPAHTRCCQALAAVWQQ